MRCFYFNLDLIIVPDCNCGCSFVLFVSSERFLLLSSAESQWCRSELYTHWLKTVTSPADVIGSFNSRELTYFFVTLRNFNGFVERDMNLSPVFLSSIHAAVESSFSNRRIIFFFQIMKLEKYTIFKFFVSVKARVMEPNGLLKCIVCILTDNCDMPSDILSGSFVEIEAAQIRLWSLWIQKH